MKAYFGDSYGKTLLEYSSATFFGSKLYGSLRSLHANSSLVHVSRQYHRPGFVAKYLRVTVLLKSNAATSSNKTVTVFIATINWLDEHSYRGWFGAPVEVWQKVTHHSMLHTFVPVTDIAADMHMFHTK